LQDSGIYETILTVKGKKDKAKARVNPQGLMGSACRIEKPKRGKGSFQRRKKHTKNYDY